MGMFQNKMKSVLLLSAIGVVTFFGFQNCSGIGFSAPPQTIVDAACEVPAGCTSAASTTVDSKKEDLYNFVAGDEVTCESSILTRLGVNGSCSIGGGCGLACGMPGPSCPSANPSLWGACIDTRTAIPNPTVVAPTPTPTPVMTNTLYNFVAGDEITCESSILTRLGVNGSCSIGGGCGLACGMPGPSCPSANPSLWGACLQK